MRGLITSMILTLFTGLSCTHDESIAIEQETVFSIPNINQDNNDDGRIASGSEPKSVMVTIEDGDGTVVANRKELALHQFGDSYLSVPLTLKTNGLSAYRLTEFFVIGSDNEITHATPREGSELAHLVSDPLDIEFAVSKDVITTVAPEVLAVDENSNPSDYGYGQFGFSVVNTISTVFSAFAKGVNNFELTDAHLRIEGLTDNHPDGATLWTYDADLQAKANILTIQQANYYRLTATKSGYTTWTKILPLMTGAKIEILLEKKALDVFVAGYLMNSAGRFACYWKNGELVQLSDLESTAQEIVVANGDIYVTGDYVHDVLPIYWKNGQKLTLPTINSQVAQTSHIAVAGNDVHVTGMILRRSTGRYFPVYWKNEQLTTLDKGMDYTAGGTSSIKIVGDDVYISGGVSNSVKSEAVIWKNSELTILPKPEGYNYAFATGVAVFNGHVYVSGGVKSEGMFEAVYWRDGDIHFLAPGTESAASSIAVNGNDIFVSGSSRAGDLNTNAIYWTNLNQTTLLTGLYAGLQGITVEGGDIYTCGSYRENPNDFTSSFYWVNKTQFKCNTPPGAGALIQSIYVNNQ